MQMRTVLPGQIYRHFKNKLYQIITVATHTETEEKLVIYQALYGTYKTYARPVQMFLSEVDHEKYPDVTQKYRFELITLDDESQREGQPVVSRTVAENAALEPAKNNTEKIVKKEAEHLGVNRDLLEFLDADNYEDKMQVIIEARKRLDETTLHSMAVAMDITLAEGSRDDKIDSLIQCLQTLNKYECKRLR